jgi:hypothetical protein
MKPKELRSGSSSQKQSFRMRIAGEGIELLNRFYQKNISVEISGFHPAKDNLRTQVK